MMRIQLYWGMNDDVFEIYFIYEITITRSYNFVIILGAGVRVGGGRKIKDAKRLE